MLPIISKIVNDILGIDTTTCGVTLGHVVTFTVINLFPATRGGYYDNQLLR